MNSSRFNIRVVFQVILIAITSALFIWAVSQENKIVTSLSLAVLWIAQIVILIRYVNATNTNLLLFLQSFHFDDSSLVFNKAKKLPFKPVYQEFNRIIEQFRELKVIKETEHQYFEHIVKHAGTGLIAWDKEGKVQLFNTAAKKLLQIPHIIHLEGLSRIDFQLPDRLRSLKPGHQDIIKLFEAKEIKSISIRASEFHIGDKWIKLVSFQNIRPELEEREAEAWQKLIKVLTHEIVNSVSPIKIVSSSLIDTIRQRGKPGQHGKLNEEDMNNIMDGLQAIHTRSKGLSKFVEDYQAITEIPKPEFTEVKASDLIKDNVSLLKDSLIPDQVKVNISVDPPDLTIRMDKNMSEQILINVLKNSIYALTDHQDPLIEINACITGSGKVIEVIDNGDGIPFNILDYIFMPFFTTKQEGSGIGLTLSRQLMKSQQGMIRVASKEGEGTKVVLVYV